MPRVPGREQKGASTVAGLKQDVFAVAVCKLIQVQVLVQVWSEVQELVYDHLQVHASVWTQV